MLIGFLIYILTGLFYCCLDHKQVNLKLDNARWKIKGLSDQERYICNALITTGWKFKWTRTILGLLFSPSCFIVVIYYLIKENYGKEN